MLETDAGRSNVLRPLSVSKRDRRLWNVDLDHVTSHEYADRRR